MAKKKKLTKKIKNLIQNDILASLAFASLLLNIFFFSGMILFSATNKLDEDVFRAAYSNLCDENYVQNLQQRMEESTSPELAQVQFEVDCLQGDFDRYYRNAVEAYYTDRL